MTLLGRLLPLCTLLGVCLTNSSGRAESLRPPRDRPHILVVIADDLGWGDLACYGSDRIRTPRLDALAAGGVRWTQFYAASSICTPTRCSILTGRYPQRFGLGQHLPLVTERGLPDDTVTLPRLLRAAGYRTAHVGKWHLGRENLAELGFDHALITRYPWAELGGQDSFLHRDGVDYTFRNGRKVAPSSRFLAEYYADEAIALLEEACWREEPLFLNLWFYAPHTPYNLAPEPYRRDYQGEAEDTDLKYRSMVTCLDASIGRVVDRLEALGMLDNTLILFASDNGPSEEGSAGPYLGGKSDLHEGGIRVPMIAHWPARIAPGRVTEAVGHTNDLLATCCAAAGLPLPGDVAFDGIDLLPHLVEEEPVGERALFWSLPRQKRYPRPGRRPMPHATQVIRRGRWKLSAYRSRALRLIDLQADPGESQSRLRKETETRKALLAELRGWLQPLRQASEQK
ncbi:MAG: sulfatase-like hydrolase/transferase [Planctomycetota bacterium]